MDQQTKKDSKKLEELVKKSKQFKIIHYVPDQVKDKLKYVFTSLVVLYAFNGELTR